MTNCNPTGKCGISEAENTELGCAMWNGRIGVSNTENDSVQCGMVGRSENKMPIASGLSKNTCTTLHMIHIKHSTSQHVTMCNGETYIFSILVTYVGTYNHVKCHIRIHTHNRFSKKVFVITK